MLRMVTLADGISLLNALFGLLAILVLLTPVVVSVDVRIRLSFSLILLAILADGLDGIVARRTRHGELGEYLEAMADMTSLGIAPAVFVYTLYTKSMEASLYLTIGVLGTLVVFVALSIIRLASFHILKDNKAFTGLPASASTIFIIGLAYLAIPILYLLPVILILSLAMVSTIPFPKMSVRLNTLAAILIIIALVLGKFYYGAAIILLLLALGIYVVAGPVYIRT